MHHALAGLVGHGTPTVAFAAIVVGGVAIFRTWLGLVPVVIGLLIIPWHYLVPGAITAAVFAGLAVLFGK